MRDQADTAQISENVCLWHKADILVALSRCLLSGVKRTSRFHGAMSAFDPKRTSANVNFKLRRQNGTLPCTR
jgi:hypothetical protein